MSWLYDIIIRSLSSISVTFKNAIYAEAAQGFHEGPSCDTLSLLLFLWLFIIVSVFLALCFFESPSFAKRVGTFTERIAPSKHRLVISYIEVLIVITIVWGVTTNTKYINKITTKSLNSIEVIAPFIEQKEYLSLKSDFLRIKNADDYENFYRKMAELGRKHEVELSLFEPL